MAHDQVIAPGRTGKPFWTRVGAIIAGLATVVGIVTGGIAIVDFLRGESGPATFTGSLDTRDGMRAFLRFAEDHDGEVVRLETRCLYVEGPRTCVDQADPLDRATVLLDLNDDEACEPERVDPCDGSVVLYFFSRDTAEAQIDNGEFGAGNIVVRGYFTVSNRGNLGTLPPGVTAIYLTAVPVQDVPQS